MLREVPRHKAWSAWPIEAFLEPGEPGEDPIERAEVLPLLAAAEVVVVKDVMSGSITIIRGEHRAIVIELDETAGSRDFRNLCLLLIEARGRYPNPEE